METYTSTWPSYSDGVGFAVCVIGSNSLGRKPDSNVIAITVYNSLELDRVY